MCALYEVKSMLKNPPSTTAVAASIRKDQEPALGRTGCTESTDCTGCTGCTGCTNCIGCTECTELACVADAKRGWKGGGGKGRRGKEKGAPAIRVGVFVFRPRFSQLIQ